MSVIHRSQQGITSLHHKLGKREEDYRRQLGSFGITGDLALRPIASLSGGQKSRLAFAVMAMPRYNVSVSAINSYSLSIFRPNFLIFDEPTNHLDVETVDALAKAFKKFKVHVHQEVSPLSWSSVLQWRLQAVINLLILTLIMFPSHGKCLHRFMSVCPTVCLP